MSHISQARSLDKYFLLVDNILVVLDFFVVFPPISIRLVDQMGWAALMVGIALGLRQLVQQELDIFDGAIVDRFSTKPMIVTGILVRISGFAVMAVAHEPWVFWLSCILSGLDGALFSPPRATLVVRLVCPHQRDHFFPPLVIQNSTGAVIGALLGNRLLQYGLRLMCNVGAALFTTCAAFNVQYLPVWRLSIVKTPVHEGLGQVLRSKRFIACVLTLTGRCMLVVQVVLMLPTMVSDIVGSPAVVKWMHTIGTTISLTLLYPTAHWNKKRYRPGHRLMAGLLVIILAVLLTGMTSSLRQLFTLIYLPYIGSTIVGPARETLDASLTDSRTRGSYMGFSRLGLAFGDALGCAGGGWLFDAGKTMGQPKLPWLMLDIIGFITFLTLW